MQFVGFGQYLEGLILCSKKTVESQQNFRPPLNLLHVLLPYPQLHGSSGHLSGSCPGDERPGDSPRTDIEWKNLLLENIPFLKGFHDGYMHVNNCINYIYFLSLSSVNKSKVRIFHQIF